MTGDCPAALLVQRWVQRLVIGEGLCPFAARPMAEGRVRITCSDASAADDAYRDVLAEVERLLTADPALVETTLLAVPGALADFQDYLDVLAACEDALDELGLASELQIASFHPHYLFADEPEDDPGHYTNRSPCPVFHLIRQESITRALAHWPDPQEIPQRNRRRMRELGVDYLRGLSAGRADPD